MYPSLHIRQSEGVQLLGRADQDDGLETSRNLPKAQRTQNHVNPSRRVARN